MFAFSQIIINLVDTNISIFRADIQDHSFDGLVISKEIRVPRNNYLLEAQC